MRRRGTTLIELMATISLLTALVLLVGRFGVVAVRWGETAGQLVATATGEERLRRALLETATGLRPIPALSITDEGEIVEREVPRAAASWGAGGFAFRGADAYHVLERSGRNLVHRRIGLDGCVGQPEVVVPGVSEASFEVVARDGRAVGLRYSLRVSSGPSIRGFFAFRAEAPAGEPPRAPAPAPRWKGGAR